MYSAEPPVPCLGWLGGRVRPAPRPGSSHRITRSPASAGVHEAADNGRASYYLLMNADNDVRGRRLPDDQVDLAVEVFRMLADATRVQILWALLAGERSVTDLAESAGKAPASVSQHLAKLRMARLVRTRREGTTIFYRLHNDHVTRLITDAVYNAEHAGPGTPEHHHGDQPHRPAEGEALPS